MICHQTCLLFSFTYFGAFLTCTEAEQGMTSAACAFMTFQGSSSAPITKANPIIGKAHLAQWDEGEKAEEWSRRKRRQTAAEFFLQSPSHPLPCISPEMKYL